MQYLADLAERFVEALRSLLPIVAVVLAFQIAVFRRPPDDALALLGGLLLVAAGIAVFLLGLDLSVFPAGRSLASQFARQGSVTVMMAFAFAIGFAATVAEPALIAVADQAEQISEGRISSGVLRIIVAGSVGAVLVLGIFRLIGGWELRWLVIPGYLAVLAVTSFAPAEIVGLAYDSGGVTTNIVTVPLIAAIGLGLASSLGGRHPLQDGFGLVALAVMVPMISVQLYGIWEYRKPVPSVPPPSATEASSGAGLELFLGLFDMVRNVLPLVLVILFFQFFILRKKMPHGARVGFGFVAVLLGLYAFVLGLKWGLLPLGTLMATQLIDHGATWGILLFAGLIGFATTMAEPALIAIGREAERAAPARLRARTVRIVVAVGVALGMLVGVYRLINGGSFHLVITVGYGLVIVLALLAPKTITPLAFDLGGVTTSEVTVPVITALGLGLAAAIPGRSVMIDGFGLIAFASIGPIVTVLLYGIVTDRLARTAEKELP